MLLMMDTRSRGAFAPMYADAVRLARFSFAEKIAHAPEHLSSSPWSR